MPSKLYNAVFHMKEGGARRRAIIDAMQNPEEPGIYLTKLPVNCKWQANTNKDRDLQRLLKEGLLVRSRDSGMYSTKHPDLGWNKSTHKRQTYLVLASKAK